MPNAIINKCTDNELQDIRGKKVKKTPKPMYHGLYKRQSFCKKIKKKMKRRKRKTLNQNYVRKYVSPLKCMIYR